MNPYCHTQQSLSAYPSSHGYVSSTINPYGSWHGSAYGFNSYNPMSNEHLWQGYFGRSAEYLGRLNNFLSMTGMLVDNISNHVKLLYSKGQELQIWYAKLVTFTNGHSKMMETLGFQVESSWLLNENEENLRRRMWIRRIRTFLLVSLLFAFLNRFRKRTNNKRRNKLEEAFQFNKNPSYH